MVKDIAFGIIISLLFISLIVLFCAILIKLYIKKIKEHNLKELDFQKTLNKTILETQEQVFENISQDLHDDIGQQLTFVNFQLEKIKLGSSDQLDDLEQLTQSVSRVSGSVRDLSHSLNSNLVLQNDLQKAIKSEVERIKKHNAIEVSFQSSLSNYNFTNTEKIILYRIFQEAIANILKHSNATKVRVSMKQNPNFEFKISDNGKGFDIVANSKNSLGLINLQSRCDMINYNLEIVSKTNEGTTILITKKANQNE